MDLLRSDLGACGLDTLVVTVEQEPVALLGQDGPLFGCGPGE